MKIKPKSSLLKTAAFVGVVKVFYNSLVKFGFIDYVFEEEDLVFPSFYSWLCNSNSLVTLSSKLIVENSNASIKFNQNYEGLYSDIGCQKLEENYNFKKEIDYGVNSSEVFSMTSSGVFRDSISKAIFYVDSQISERKIMENTIPVKTIKVKVPRNFRHKFDRFIKRIYTSPAKPKEPENLTKDFDRIVSLGSISAPDLDLSLLDDSAKIFYKDLEEFLNSEEWYKNKKFKYKRSYLFYGLPGTGKTTMIQQVAKAFKKDIIYLSISEILNTHSAISLTRASSTRKNTIILIEDLHNIKSFIKNNTEAMDRLEQVGSLTPTGREIFENKHGDFSPLLNFLDGALSLHGQIVCMTTNNKESLPDTLLRKGRVNVDLEVKPLSPDKINANYNHFYNLPLGSNSINRNYVMTMADLSDILILNKHSPDKAKILIEEHK